MFERYAVEQVNSETGRYYITPDNKQYPSVTRVLQILSEDGIRIWREKVGVDVANHISKRATDIGTEYHRLIERFLTDGIEDKTKNLYAKAHFHNILESGELFNIKDIQGLEIPLWSHDLQVAGTCDCVCGDYEGVPTIIDFKTSEKKKTAEYIKGYFMQGAAYAYMVEEIYGFKPKQIAIMISGADNTFQVYKEDPKRWIEPFRNVRNIYADMYEST